MLGCKASGGLVGVNLDVGELGRDWRVDPGVQRQLESNMVGKLEPAPQGRHSWLLLELLFY